MTIFQKTNILTFKPKFFVDPFQNSLVLQSAVVAMLLVLIQSLQILETLRGTNFSNWDR